MANNTLDACIKKWNTSGIYGLMGQELLERLAAPPVEIGFSFRNALRCFTFREDCEISFSTIERTPRQLGWERTPTSDELFSVTHLREQNIRRLSFVEIVAVRLQYINQPLDEVLFTPSKAPMLYGADRGFAYLKGGTPPGIYCKDMDGPGAWKLDTKILFGL